LLFKYIICKRSNMEN